MFCVYLCILGEPCFFCCFADPSEEEGTQILSSASLTISQCFELLVTLNLLEKDLDLEISLFERACEQLDHNLAANMTLKRVSLILLS